MAIWKDLGRISKSWNPVFLEHFSKQYSNEELLQKIHEREKDHENADIAAHKLTKAFEEFLNLPFHSK